MTLKSGSTARSATWSARRLQVAVLQLLLTTCLGCPATSSSISSARKVDDGVELRFIELQRRNWESHGINVSIDSTGSFTVAVVYLGATDTIRIGRLTSQEWSDLTRRVTEVDASNLRREYTAPVRSTTRWWGYQLTVARATDIIAVRYHSEDPSVPQTLIDLVDLTLRLTGDP
jgi:hypothetical protein